MSTGFTDYSQPPLSYTTPSFPSLYWPFDTSPGQPQYLYSLTDIWMFTVYWTLITVTAAHFLVAVWGVLMQFCTATQRKRYLKNFDENGYEIRMVQNRGEWPAWFKLPWAPKGEHDKPKDVKKARRAARIETEQDQKASPDVEAEQDLRLDTLQSDGKTSVDLSAVNSPSSAPKTSPARNPRRRLLSAKNRKLYGESPINEALTWAWSIPLIYLVLGGLEALLGGSLVGLVLGAVYNAGYFRMSTWTPLMWGIINVLVLILGSFRIQGGL